MKLRKLWPALLLMFAFAAFAQETAPAPPGPRKGGPRHNVMFKRQMGAWWKDSKIVSQLGLNDSQVKQLEATFYQHKLTLIDVTADLEKKDLKLQQLLDADTLDESTVNAALDQVLAARGKLEREFTTLTLNFRKILSVDQWKQLKQIRGDDPGIMGPGPMMFRQHFKVRNPGGPGGPPDAPPPPPDGDQID